jgi:hypothetical protein
MWHGPTMTPLRWLSFRGSVSSITLLSIRLTGPPIGGVPRNALLSPAGLASPSKRRLCREAVLLACIGSTLQSVGQDELFGPLPSITTATRITQGRSSDSIRKKPSPASAEVRVLRVYRVCVSLCACCCMQLIDRLAACP